MAATHEDHAPMTAARGGCYICTDPNDVVAFDVTVEGEGVLVLCTNCVLEAAVTAAEGRSRLRGTDWMKTWASS